jgi:imidazolonepropionase-like amidohydrolase
MSTAQAIEAATRVAAQACGVAPLVGTLEPGKEADLLIVGGNPLEDIECIADVKAVYKAGRAVGPMLLPR